MHSSSCLSVKNHHLQTVIRANNYTSEASVSTLHHVQDLKIRFHCSTLKLPVLLKLYVCVSENCSSAVAQLCVMMVQDRMLPVPRQNGSKSVGLQLFSLGPTLPRESALLTVSGSWFVLLLLLFFRSLHDTFFSWLPQVQFQ